MTLEEFYDFLHGKLPSAYSKNQIVFILRGKKLKLVEVIYGKGEPTKFILEEEK